MTQYHSVRNICSVLLAALILVLGVCFHSETAEAAQSEKKMTLILYMCGSNLESDNGAATADITEMLRSRYNSEAVNVIALLGGTRKWWGGMDAQQTAIYEISGNRPKQVWADGLMNMGDPDTLSTLLDYSYENYPAEEYALILWNHGGGPMSGVCWDDLSQSDNLTMDELQTALDNSPCVEKPLEWIGFDACLMSSVETAHLMAPYARYMIASQETEPGTGWSYSFLADIEEDIDGAAMGKHIIDSYIADTSVQEGLTLSCTDLSKIADVEECMDAFFKDLSVDLTEDTFSALSNMRQDAHGYGRSESASNDLDLVDLEDLISHYADQSPENAAALEAAIKEAVVYTQSTEPDSNGLSVYHPYYNKTLYQQKAAEEGIDSFIKVFVDAINDSIGGSLTGESMQELNTDQITLLAYSIIHEEIMDGGFVQLIHNGYGPFVFKNPFAKVMKVWGLTELGKLIYKAHELYKKHGEEIERDCTDDEFMALFEKYPKFDDLDDEFVENEEEWTNLIAHYVDEHIEQFVTIVE